MKKNYSSYKKSPSQKKPSVERPSQKRTSDFTIPLSEESDDFPSENRTRLSPAEKQEFLAELKRKKIAYEEENHMLFSEERKKKSLFYSNKINLMDNKD